MIQPILFPYHLPRQILRPCLNYWSILNVEGGTLKMLSILQVKKLHAMKLRVSYVNYAWYTLSRMTWY
jgi:hypothetical protein